MKSRAETRIPQPKVVRKADALAGVNRRELPASEWRKVRLGKICSKIGSGATPRGGAQVYIDFGVSLIRSQNVYNSHFKYDGLSHITEEAANKLKNVTVKPNDILLNITGDSVARCCIVPDKILPARVNQHVAILRPYAGELLPEYLQAVLVLPDMQAFMVGLASSQGGSRNALTKGNIEQFEVTLPPLPIQRRIAEVLGAYDDLIENNRRRIALLENMARELYRERFVRRAGKGRVITLGEIAKFARGKVITKNDARPGEVPVIAGGLEPAYYHDVANTVAPVVTVSGSGANAGYAAIHFQDVWVSDCSWVDANSCKHPLFAYCFLKENEVVLRNLQQGAAQPHVYPKDINALEVYLPEGGALSDFEAQVVPLFDEQANLLAQNRSLARQRDALLPRLMSGKIDLGKLEKEAS